MDGLDVVAIMKWVHVAWNGRIIGNRAKPGNQLVYSCGSAIWDMRITTSAGKQRHRVTDIVK